LKKQISPVVTVIVILVVVVIVALLWNHFGNPPATQRGGRGGGGFGGNFDMSKLTPEKLDLARKNAQAARAKLLGQVKGSKGSGEKAGEE